MSAKVHLAETPEEQRKWMEQWRAAAIALRRVKREELRAIEQRLRKMIEEEQASG